MASSNLKRALSDALRQVSDLKTRELLTAATSACRLWPVWRHQGPLSPRRRAMRRL